MFGTQILGRIFGSDTALNKITDSAVNGLDKLVYTSEEKEEDRQKTIAMKNESITKAREQVVEWMKATQGQNLARRLLALVITSVWLFMYIVSTLISFVNIFIGNAATSERLQLASTLVGDRATEMGGAMMLILGFYFGAPYMSDIVKTSIARFGGPKNRDSATSGSQTIG